MVGKLTKAVFGAALCLGAVDGQFITKENTACRMNATDLQQRCFPTKLGDQPCAEMDKLTLEDVKGNVTDVKAACEAICNARQNCKAIEYKADTGNCEIWNVDIPATNRATGYTCAIYNGTNDKTDKKIYVQLDMEVSSKNWTEGLQSANLTSYTDFTTGLALFLFNTLNSTTNPILNAGVSKLLPGQIHFGLEKKNNETFAMRFVFEENVGVKDVNILAVHILLADRDLDKVKSLKSNLVDGIKALMGMAEKEFKLDSITRKIVFEKPALGNPLLVLSEFFPSSDDDKESSSYFKNGFLSFVAASMMAAFAW